MKQDFSGTAFRYVFEFIVAGFIGWLYEVITVWIMWGYFDNRGMLHMPIVPIYAVGAFLLLAVMGEKKRSPLYIFLFSAVITTIFELGASYLLEFIFHKRFWTYRTWWGSILDRSSVLSSAIFGLFALIYFFGLHRISGKLSEKLPKPVCIGFSAVAVTAVLIDLVISVNKLLGE
ncbi:MAG: putative ABC transporter permease [Ruminococcus flavefaciens]|nr:putative ABC transporter permease [Ruminococcus flavefaciens]MCM1229006.1 putative ABC transporter permease [Ruminococcus flavefaciens]